MGRNRFRSLRVAVRVLALPLSVCLALGLPLYAQDQTIAQMVHTSWTAKDGAPLAIDALAQTPDGLLWIGSAGGLFNFDGLKFAAFSPKSGPPLQTGSQIRSLFVSREGDLWVLFFHGPPARIRQGSVRFFDRAEGEPINTFSDGVQQDSEGTLWAFFNWKHIVHLGSDNVWHRGADPTGDTGHISELFIDSSDTQWVIGNNLLYRRPKGQAGFAATTIQVFGLARLAEDPDHTLWVIGQEAGQAGAAKLQHIDRAGQRLFTPRIRGALSDMLVAADGSLWFSKTNGELERLRAQDRDSHSSAHRPDVYALKSGIRDLGFEALLQDVDGNTWVGGTDGLDRFERASLVPAIADSKVGEWFTCVGSQGTVWIGNGSGELFSLDNGSVTKVLSGGGGGNLSCGTTGRAYFLQTSGITAVRSGRVQRLPLLPGFKGYGDHYLFLGLVEDREGGLIASVGGSAGHGLWRYHEGKWSPFLPDLKLPEVCGMLNDRRRGLYLAFTPPVKEIGKITAGSLESQSLPISVIGFAHSSYGIVAYGGKGIAVERDKGFQVISFLRPEYATMVSGVVEAPGRDLWLMGARGVVRVPADEVRAALADPTHAVSSVNLKEGEFTGPDRYLLFRQSAAIDPAGRLWFSTLNGVVSVDADRLRTARRPPQLTIQDITADGHDLSANGTFPPNTQYLHIQYFGLDLSKPMDVVYRYRLEGLDTTWQNVGNRTEAIYTHLRPGSYRFQVVASSGNDIWTKPVSSTVFRILPRFYERQWVQVLFLLAGAILVWIGISIRMNYVSSAIRIRAEERAEERVRIARDLHDTLLQGVQGLLLSFHVAAEKVQADHESKKALEKALTTADRIILEGRNRVTRLRSENLTDAELKSLIEGVGADLSGFSHAKFTVERKGERRALQRHVVDEVFCIAREALTNAFRHSEASRILIELDYQKGEFRMSCRDNGRGFDAIALSGNATNGHWGLRGMAERAERIGANFACTSNSDQGTEIQVRMPGRIAYARSSRLGQLFGGRRGA